MSPLILSLMSLLLINLASPTWAKPCPQRWQDLPPKLQGLSLSCECSVGSKGSVWGSQLYTTDSDLCRAAQHAGLLSSLRSWVDIQPASGCAFYTGSKANGVQTSSWGPYQSSFFFPKKGRPSCPILKEGGVCPAQFNMLPKEQAVMGFLCRCPPEAIGGMVWGNQIYTTDSSLCRAARHAGVIDHKGGLVKVKAALGCRFYQGSTRFGIKTAPWGPYASSFFFPGYGTGRCSVQ